MRLVDCVTSSFSTISSLRLHTGLWTIFSGLHISVFRYIKYKCNVEPWPLLLYEFMRIWTNNTCLKEYQRLNVHSSKLFNCLPVTLCLDALIEKWTECHCYSKVCSQTVWVFFYNRTPSFAVCFYNIWSGFIFCQLPQTRYHFKVNSSSRWHRVGRGPQGEVLYIVAFSPVKICFKNYSGLNRNLVYVFPAAITLCKFKYSSLNA